MSQLQKLLDEKWPISNDLNPHDHLNIVSMRHAFTEGYNAAKEEILKDKQFMDELERDYDPNWDHSDFHTIK